MEALLQFYSMFKYDLTPLNDKIIIQEGNLEHVIKICKLCFLGIYTCGFVVSLTSEHFSFVQYYNCQCIREIYCVQFNRKCK